MPIEGGNKCLLKSHDILGIIPDTKSMSLHLVSKQPKKNGHNPPSYIDGNQDWEIDKCGHRNVWRETEGFKT